MTFQDELRALVQKNGVPFDERYVWDWSVRGCAPTGLASYWKLTQAGSEALAWALDCRPLVLKTEASIRVAMSEFALRPTGCGYTKTETARVERPRDSNAGRARQRSSA